MNNQTDIIIVGAGVVGLTLAALLVQQTHFKVLLLEASPLKIKLPEDGFAPRVSAINTFSGQVFDSLGIWQDLLVRAGQFESMSVWESNGEQIDFSAKDSTSNLGYLLENDNLRLHLLNKLADNPQFTLVKDTILTQYTQDKDSVIVKLKDGQEIVGKLLVAADGANSFVRSNGNFNLKSDPYGHDAMVCHVESEQPHKNIARQWFLETGPLALLPLLDKNRCSIVWSSSKDDVDRLMGLGDQEFCDELSGYCHFELGKVINCTQRFRFPLIMRHCEQYIDGRVVLIGDAAHTIHPLAGQGLNLGIQDAVALADKIVSGKEIYSRSALRSFERERKAENWQMLVAMRAFKNIFAFSSPVLQSIISLGVRFTQKIPTVKTFFMKVARGPIENLPKWIKKNNSF